MAIVLVRRDDQFGAVITTPHFEKNYWSTDGFVSRQELIDALVAHGIHKTDIGDLLSELDDDKRKFCAVMP